MTGGRCYERKNEKYLTVRGTNAEGTDLLSGWTGCQQDSGAKLGGEHHPVLLCKGEEISSHKSDGDAFVTCLDGIGKITIDGTEYLLHEGKSIVMPAGHPHAVYGQEAFKMLLVVVF